MDNKTLHKLSNYFKIEKYRKDTRIIIFLICLAIATILWFLNALGKDYNTQIEYPVKYVSMPKNQFLANDLPESFTLKVNAHGFTLLRHKLHLSFTPIVLNVNTLIKNQGSSTNNYHNINTARLINRVSQQISNEINISEIQPSNFSIVLDSLKSKTVPVKADVDIEFKAQYNITSHIVIEPNEVTIKGPGAILDQIDTVYSEQVSFKNVDQALEEKLELIEPDKISLSSEKILVKIPVSLFTENVITSHVFVEGKPDSVKIKLFPSTIKVSFKVGLDKFSEITGRDFRFSVPYKDILDGAPNTTIQVNKTPDFILDLKYSPLTLEYLIEKQ